MRNNDALRPFQLSHPHQKPAVFFHQRRVILAAKTRLALRQHGFNTLENGLASRRIGGGGVGGVIEINVPHPPQYENTIPLLSGEFPPENLRLSDKPLPFSHAA